MESEREANDERGWIQGLNVDIAIILFFEYNNLASAFNYAWAKNIITWRSRAPRWQNVTLANVLYNIIFAQSRTLTRGVHIMYMHDRAT